VLRWHRDWAPSTLGAALDRNRAGRRAIDPALRSLIADMASANRLWGAPSIHGELHKFGAVSQLVALYGRPDRLRLDNGSELNAYLFHSTQEAQHLSDAWLVGYKERRPHDALGGV
jgi:transposase InsO family protein